MKDKPIKFDLAMTIFICVIWLIVALYQNSLMQKKDAEIARLNDEITSLREETQLDPCPVCDGHNTHVIHDDEYDISIKCDDCGTTFGFYQDLEDALAIWNNVKG